MKLRIAAASTVAVAMLWGGSAIAAPSLAVTANAAQAGTNFGLEVDLDGGSSAAFVQDNSPAAETTYRARFWLDVNDLTTGLTRQQHMIFTANPANGGTGGPEPVLRAWLLNEGSNDKWRVRVWCRDNSLPFVKGAPITLANTNPPPRLIEVTWQAATTNVSGDGSCSIQRFGGADPIVELTGLQNDELDIRRVRLGAIASLDASTLGTYYLDEFESFR